MKKFVLLLLFCCISAAFAEELTAEIFLKKMQNAAEFSSPTYGILEGIATHSRRENNRKIVEEYPCFMATIITPGKSITQIIIDNDEGYTVGRVQNQSTAVQKNGKKSGIMERIGVSPRDLAMSFLDGELIRELPGENLRMVPCRILILKSKENSEWVKIYAAKEYLFTLKADFFNEEPTEKSIPIRTLEVNSFGKENDLYYAKHIEMSGPGWRTDIEFDKAEMNFYDPRQGKKIFRTIQ